MISEFRGIVFTFSDLSLLGITVELLYAPLVLYIGLVNYVAWKRLTMVEMAIRSWRSTNDSDMNCVDVPDQPVR